MFKSPIPLLGLPRFELKEEIGEAHQKTFTMIVMQKTLGLEGKLIPLTFVKIIISLVLNSCFSQKKLG